MDPTVDELEDINKAISEWIDNDSIVSQNIRELYKDETNRDFVFGSFLTAFTSEDAAKLDSEKGDASAIIDTVMKNIEKKFAKLLRNEDGKRFVTSSIPYLVRRNLFERFGVFQQKTFDFEIRYSKAKESIFKLRRWLLDKEIGAAPSKFILVYVTIYMILDDLARRTYGNKVFSRFWREEYLSARVKNRPILYDSESWVYHPLTDAEDREYLLIIGRELLEMRKKEHEKEEKETNNIRKITTMKITNAKIRILCYDIKGVLDEAEFIAKNYNVTFASKFDSLIQYNQEKLRDLYDRFITIRSLLEKWKLYDHSKKTQGPWILPNSIRLLDKKKIFKTAKINWEYLLSLVNVLISKIVIE